MEQSERLQTIDHYEDSKFRDQISLLSSESSWRPVNLLVFGTSLMMNAISLVSMFMLLCSFQPVIAVLLFAALIPQGVLSYKIQQQAFETLVSNSEDSRKLAYYSETLLSAAHIKEVRLYKLYGFFQNKYRSAYRRIHASVQKGRVRQCVFASAFLILTGVVSVLGFCHIAYAVRGHRLDVGTILVYTSAIVYTIQGISRFVEDSSLLYDTLLYMSNLFSYLAIENAAGFDGTREWTDFGEMKVEHLSFRYPQCEKQVLDEVSFSVKKGEKIAIVGENGAGKSTLVTHRMASVRDADKVLFLRDGRVLGFDAHEVLLRTNGHYREICQMQASMYQDLEKGKKNGSKV